MEIIKTENSTNIICRLVLSGLSEGVSIDEAVSRIGNRLAGSRTQLREVLSTDGYVLKKSLSSEDANRHVAFLADCGVRAEAVPEEEVFEIDLPPSRTPSVMGDTDDAGLIRRLVDYEKISGALWVPLGIFQCLTVFLIIAGVWNIVAGWSRFKMSKRIAARESKVPADYESTIQLVVIGLINLLFGAFIGIAFVAFDFFIREKILSNRHLFSNDVSRGPATDQPRSVSQTQPDDRIGFRDRPLT